MEMMRNVVEISRIAPGKLSTLNATNCSIGLGNIYPSLSLGYFLACITINA